MKKNASPLALLAGALLTLSACQLYDPTLRPDYAIRVEPTAQGGVATAPECPTYAAAIKDPYDNQPMPQFGCANARNLSMMVETPNDLVDPKQLGAMRGTAAVGMTRRYDNNQTRGLVMPGAEDSQVAVTTSSTAASNMGGDITGATGPSGASSSAGAAAASP